MLAPESSPLPADQSKTRGPPRLPPATGADGVQLALQLLTTGRAAIESRAVEVCREAGAALVEEAERREEAAAVNHAANGGGAKEGDDEDSFSPREGETAAPSPSPSAPLGPHGATERLQAAYVLVAGSAAALERNTAASVDSAVLLAEAACRAAPGAAPFAAVALAWARLRQCTKLPDHGAQAAGLSAAAAAASSAAAALLQMGTLDRDGEAWLARAAWALAALSELPSAKACVNGLLASSPRHAPGLLLLAGLHSADGDCGGAVAAAAALLRAHPGDIAGGLLLAALRQQRAGGAGTGGRGGEALGEELAAALALVRDFAVAASPPGGEAFGRKRSLKAFCLHAAPGEAQFEPGTAATADGDAPSTASTAVAVLTQREACRRAAGYWALLAQVALLVGALSVAEVAVEAGLEYVAGAKGALHRPAFADLVCCRARLALLRLRDSLPVITASPVSSSSQRQQHQQKGLPVREPNLLGAVRPAPSSAGASAARAAEVSLFALKAEVRGGGGSDGGVWFDPTVSNSGGGGSDAAVPRDLGVIFTHLLKAAEVCPDHAEARYVMGVVRLYEASLPDLPRREAEHRRAAAAQCFGEAARLAPLSSEPLLGLGCVREAQGAIDVALEAYAAAAEISLGEPIIPFARFLFLFE